MFEINLWINSHLKVRKSHLSSPKALRSSSKFSLLFIFQVPVKFCILCGFDCVSAERLLSSVSSAAFLQAFSLRFSPSVPVLPPFLLPMCNDPSWQTKPPRPLPPLPLNRHIYTPTHTHTHTYLQMKQSNPFLSLTLSLFELLQTIFAPSNQFD